MSTIKLKNASGGAVSIVSTDTAVDSTLTIPLTSGSFVTADVAGVVTIPGTLYLTGASSTIGIGTSTNIASAKLNVLNGSMILGAYDNEYSFIGRKANGTESSPTAMTSGQRSAILIGASYGGSTWVNHTGISYYAAETQSETARGSYITFETTALGVTSRSEKMRLDFNGNLGIGTTPNSDQAAKLHVKVGTNQNLAITPAVSVSNSVTISAVNDAYSTNIPLEIRASSTTIPMGSLIISTGNLGIGIGTASVALDILSGAANTAGDPVNAGVVNIVGPNCPTTVNYGNLNISTNDASALGAGGSISFGGRYTGTRQAKWAFIRSEPSNVGEFGGSLVFGTRTHAAGSSVERIRITPTGRLQLSNFVSTDDHIQIYGQGGVSGYGLGVENSTLYYRSAGTHGWYINSLANGGTAGVAAYLNATGFYTRDVIASRSSTTGYVFLGSNTTKYLGYDGSNYVLPTASLYVKGSLVSSTAADSGVAWHAVRQAAIGGTTSNWNTHFTETPAHNRTWTESSTAGPSGTWWFIENMRHSNAGGYWGRQYAHGWEDNANKLFVRNVSNNVWGSWVEFLSTSGATFSGALTMSGNITAYSDEKLKKNWVNFDNTFVEKLSKVKSGTFERIDMEDKKQVGVSAQDIQKIMPEAVLKDDKDTLSVAYGNAALAACVELAKEIQLLKAEIALLKGSK